MVDGRPHEFVSDACERDLEQNLGENISEVVLTFNVAWNRNRRVTDSPDPSLELISFCAIFAPMAFKVN